MIDLQDLVETEFDDPELIPEILPADSKFSIRASADILLGLFEKAASVLPVKEVIAGTSHALLEAIPTTGSALAHIRITATNGDQTVSVVADSVKVLIPGSVLVPGKKIFEILKTVPDSMVRMEITGTTATIRSGRAVWAVQIPVGDKLPPMPSVEDIELEDVPVTEFLDALTVVRKAASTTTARPSLMQIQIQNGALTGTDGGRLHRQSVSSLPGKMDLTIPTQVADELIRLLKRAKEDTFQMGGNDRHLVFQIEQDFIVAQRLVLDFPNVETLILAPAFSNTNTLTLDRAELLSAVQHVRVSADPDYASISLGLIPGKTAGDGEQTWRVVVAARDASGSAAQEVIDAQWVGTPKSREIYVNHKYLTDLVSLHSDDSIIFRVGDDTKREKTPLFLEDKTTGFTGFIQQMRPGYL